MPPTLQAGLGKILPRFDESLDKGSLRPEDSTPNRYLARFLVAREDPAQLRIEGK